MNTLQNVYDRLSDKTELAKHEVELGTIQDVYKEIDTIGVESQKGFDTTFKAKGFLSEAIGYENRVQKKYQDIYVQLTKLKGTIKDLGLPTNEIEDKLKLVKSRITKAEDNLKRLKQVIQIL